MELLVNRVAGAIMGASVLLAAGLTISTVRDAEAQCPPTGCTTHWGGSDCDAGCDSGTQVCCWPDHPEG